MTTIKSLTRAATVSDSDVLPIYQAENGRTRSITAGELKSNFNAAVIDATEQAQAAAEQAQAAAASADATILRGDLADDAEGAGLVGFAPGESVRDALQRLGQFDADLSNSTDPLKGAGQVGFKGRTVAQKLSERASPEDNGAVRGGTGDNKAQISQALAANVKAPLSVTTTLQIRSGEVLDGDNLLFLSGSENINLTTDNVSSGVRNATIKSDAGIAIHQNAANIRDLTILGARIDAQSYGFLANTSSGGSDGCIIATSIINSALSDAVELNTTAGTNKNYLVSGNLLYAGPSGTQVNSGFAVGIAATKHSVLTGNIIRGSRQEGYHLEDAQCGNIAVGNNFNGLQTDGVRTLNASAAQGVGYGNIFAANYLERSAGSSAGGYGYRMVTDANASLDLQTVLGNHFKGFSIGIASGGDGSNGRRHIVDGNVVLGATTAYTAWQQSHSYGTNLCDSADTLVSMGSRASFGKVVAKTKPVKVINMTGPANQAGSYVKGFAYNIPVSHAGGASQNFAICPAPALMLGRIVASTNSTTDFFWACADVKFDPVNGLVVSNIVSKNGGNQQFGTFVIDNGNLAVRFFAGGAITATVSVDFDGVYYLHGV